MGHIAAERVFFNTDQESVLLYGSRYCTNTSSVMQRMLFRVDCLNRYFALVGFYQGSGREAGVGNGCGNKGKRQRIATRK
jgi:hypothetical protein